MRHCCWPVSSGSDQCCLWLKRIAAKNASSRFAIADVTTSGSCQIHDRSLTGQYSIFARRCCFLSDLNFLFCILFSFAIFFLQTREMHKANYSCNSHSFGRREQKLNLLFLHLFFLLWINLYRLYRFDCSINCSLKLLKGILNIATAQTYTVITQTPQGFCQHLNETGKRTHCGKFSSVHLSTLYISTMAYKHNCMAQ